MRAIHRLRVLVAAVAVLAMLLVTVHPAGAYYGEMEGYWGFDFSAVDRGCYATITVMPGKRVQAYCNLTNGSSGATVSKSNYYEYDCWQSWGCTYDVYISGWGGWYPSAFWLMKKDDACCLHAIINSAGTR